MDDYIKRKTKKETLGIRKRRGPFHSRLRRFFHLKLISFSVGLYFSFLFWEDWFPVLWFISFFPHPSISTYRRQRTIRGSYKSCGPDLEPLSLTIFLGSLRSLWFSTPQTVVRVNPEINLWRNLFRDVIVSRLHHQSYHTKPDTTHTSLMSWRSSRVPPTFFTISPDRPLEWLFQMTSLSWSLGHHLTNFFSGRFFCSFKQSRP